jgi:hypothetical protein
MTVKLKINWKLCSFIHSYVILFVLLYGCEAWSLNMEEEQRLRVFENSVPKRDEIRREWRRLHNEEAL